MQNRVTTLDSSAATIGLERWWSIFFSIFPNQGSPWKTGSPKKTLMGLMTFLMVLFLTLTKKNSPKTGKILAC
jgi:hypothetical protein